MSLALCDVLGQEESATVGDLIRQPQQYPQDQKDWLLGSNCRYWQ
ncbi:hypothetical protein [Pseudomonas aeruginosa]|nr:hypothetical protein [Pseudomonas aeruginosa]